MLTREQELKDLSSFTTFEMREAINYKQRMFTDDPDALLNELILFKAKDLKMSVNNLIESLMALKLNFDLCNEIPEDTPLNYTFNLFNFYFDKIKENNQDPTFFKHYTGEFEGQFLGSAEKNIIDVIKNGSIQLKIKPHRLLQQLVNSYFNFLVKGEEVDESNTHYFKTYKYFVFNLLKLIKGRPFDDILGEIYNEFFLYDKKSLGQCMTPPDVSKLLTSILYPDSDLILSRTKNYKIADISGCGTGSLILPLIEKYKSARKLHIHINDLDLEMAQAAFIQCYLNAMIHCENKYIVIKTYNCDTITEYNTKGKMITRFCMGRR